MKGGPTDAHMRGSILRDLTLARNAALDRAGRLDARSREAEWSADVLAGFATHEASHRRRAAHYQQAIDLLTAAPMPPEV